LRFTLKGDKGDPSLNVSCKGSYSSTLTYNIGDACVYDGRLYYAIVDSTLNILPTITSNWATMEHVAITSVEPTDKNILWVDIGNDHAIKIYNKTTLAWELQTLNGKTANGTLTTTEQTNLVTAINELNTNKATKDGTIQTNLNAEMVGGKYATDFATAFHTHDKISGSNSNMIKIDNVNDYAGLNKTNNVDIKSWYGVSFSNACTTTGIQGKPSVAIDARTGNIYSTGDVFINGESLFQSATNVKNKVATAINSKGGSANSSMTGDQLSNAILALTSSKVQSNVYFSSLTQGQILNFNVGFHILFIANKF
jgi:hypothetical protein